MQASARCWAFVDADEVLEQGAVARAADQGHPVSFLLYVPEVNAAFARADVSPEKTRRRFEAMTR